MSVVEILIKHENNAIFFQLGTKETESLDILGNFFPEHDWFNSQDS